MWYRSGMTLLAILELLFSNTHMPRSSSGKIAISFLKWLTLPPWCQMVFWPDASPES
jgi:hypothetical protein